jgi:toxin ParE1/3/4
MPGIGSPYKHRTRRVFPKDFPFSVVYREAGDDLVILAVAAFRKKPGYWRHRR